MTGMSSEPRRIIACNAGKIFLWARSPVAPKKTSASEWSAMGLARLFLEVTAETEPHRRLDLLREVRFAARREAAVQRRAQHRSGHGFVDRSDDGPAALAQIGRAHV